MIVDISTLKSEIIIFCKIYFFEIGSSIRSGCKHINKRKKSKRQTEREEETFSQKTKKVCCNIRFQTESSGAQPFWKTSKLISQVFLLFGIQL